MNPRSNHWQKWILLFMSLVLGLSKFFIMDWLGMRAFYITGVCFVCFLYIYFNYKKNKSVLQLWGLQGANFNKSLALLSPFLFICIFLSILFGNLYYNPVKSWHILPILVLYPIWGLIQQFIIVVIVFQVFAKMNPDKTGSLSLIVFGSILFSLIHTPDLLLMSFSICMEFFFLWVFFKWRNLWAIGLVHGWVASFLLYYVQGRDLWKELFAWF